MRNTTSRLESQMKWHNAISAIHEKLSKNKEVSLIELQDICAKHKICRVLPNLMRINNYIYKNDVNMYKLNPDKFNDIKRVEQECRKLNREQHKEYNAQRKPKKATHQFTINLNKPISQEGRDFYNHIQGNSDIIQSIVRAIPTMLYLKNLDTKHLITELQSRGYHVFSSVQL